MLTKEEMQGWLRSSWNDLPGASTTKSGHPAPYPIELAERLIKLFSFAGDTVLDPFLGTGSTSLAAIRTGRNSIGMEVEPAYLDAAKARISQVASINRMAGAVRAEVTIA
jgi:site-specific DNA-methyltransferase (adenine-specific)